MLIGSDFGSKFLNAYLGQLTADHFLQAASVKVVNVG